MRHVALPIKSVLGHLGTKIIPRLHLGTALM
jgi:hypothetical protein